MKPLGIKNYGSVPHLLGSRLGKTDKYVHEGQNRILTEKTRDKHDLVIVTEKYDGSNVGITKVHGSILALTRSGYLAETSPYRQHHYFAEWVKKQKDRFNFIGEGERLVGEWLIQVHSLKYEIAKEPFIVFDYFTSENKRLSNQDFNLKVRSNLQKPMLIHRGYSALPIDVGMDYFNNYYDYRVKTEKPEGLVYRVERKGEFDFMAKYVRPDFVPGKYCINVDEKDLIYNYNLKID